VYVGTYHNNDGGNYVGLEVSGSRSDGVNPSGVSHSSSDASSTGVGGEILSLMELQCKCNYSLCAFTCMVLSLATNHSSDGVNPGSLDVSRSSSDGVSCSSSDEGSTGVGGQILSSAM